MINDIDILDCDYEYEHEHEEDNYIDIEIDCKDTLLRLNVEEDTSKPILNQVLEELDKSLNEYNIKLYELMDKKKDIIKLLNENNIIRLETLLNSLRDIKISIFETQEDINFCINKINFYTSYINN